MLIWGKQFCLCSAMCTLAPAGRSHLSVPVLCLWTHTDVGGSLVLQSSSVALEFQHLSGSNRDLY